MRVKQKEMFVTIQKLIVKVVSSSGVSVRLWWICTKVVDIRGGFILLLTKMLFMLKFGLAI